ncbi:hypothetical protein M3Y97_00726300 [Aphelenchoides bicaudatus]|nr:hypothetical protein M3Y97_00726300 [Aphelenchoides bicaudatus]
MFKNIIVSGQSISCLQEHNKDQNSVFDYLCKTRGSVHSKYVFNVLNTYRLKDLPNSGRFRTDLSEYQFLMHGMDGKEVKAMLSGGFNHRGSKKCILGPHYYFTSCSTKAANQTCCNAWNFEKKCDYDGISPRPGDVGYIVFCLVGTGKMLPRGRDKNPDFKGDSLIYKGIYEPTCYDMITVDGVQAKLPMWPFRRTDPEQLSKHENFNYDEICVNTADKVKPVILAEVQFDGSVA